MDKESPIWAREGWAYRYGLDHVRARVLGAKSAHERGVSWGQLETRPPISEHDLLAELKTALIMRGEGLVVSFSHDDYLTVIGGVQNCVRDEEANFRENNWSYLHVFPVWPKPHLGDLVSAGECPVNLSLNGKALGRVRMSDLEKVVGILSSGGRRIEPVVHHLLGFAPEHIAAVVKSARCERPHVWLHDLFGLCPSVHLLRNEASFCGSPPVGSSVCGICVFGNEREEHLRRMRAFFEATNPRVLAPSETLLRMWEQGPLGSFCAEADVVEPGAVVLGSNEAVRYSSSRPLRVGFLGGCAYHKGWLAFEALSKWYARDERYQFIILGTDNPQLEGLKHVRVEVTPQNRSAMAAAVRSAGIDVVVNWSLCYESFSFTALEAVAGGAFLVVRSGAGNVWPLVSATHPRRGVALESEAELHALFASGEILALASTADRRVGEMTFGGGSFAAVTGAVDA